MTFRLRRSEPRACKAKAGAVAKAHGVCRSRIIKIMPYRRKPKNAANREADVLPTPLSETPEFLAYEPQVGNLILKTKCGVTASEINRVLRPPHPGWTQLALERLFEHVEERQVGAFIKYFPRELRKTPNPAEDNYHAGLFPGKPATKEWPHVESVYGEV